MRENTRMYGNSDLLIFWEANILDRFKRDDV